MTVVLRKLTAFFKQEPLWHLMTTLTCPISVDFQKPFSVITLTVSYKSHHIYSRCCTTPCSIEWWTSTHNIWQAYSYTDTIFLSIQSSAADNYRIIVSLIAYIYIYTGWSRKRIPSFIFGITSVIQHQFSPILTIRSLLQAKIYGA